METTKCERLTHIWAGTTLDGFRCMAKGQSEAAARNWVEACALLGEHEHGDAVAAVALSNAGVGNVLLHHSVAAQAAFLASEDCWRAVVAMIEMRDLPIATTSSSFHFRLAARDTESFTRLRRKRYLRLCQAGREIAQFNRLQVGPDHNAAELAARSEDLRICLTQVFGPSCAEVTLLSGQDEGSEIAHALLYEAKAKAFKRIVEAESPPLDFWTRLDCAVRLAALLVLPRAGISCSKSAYKG